MKIVIVGVAPPYRGGISLHNALLFNYLSQKHNVICYNFIRQYPNLFFPGKTQYQTKESAISIPSERILDSINPLTWYKTAQKILSENPELVIFRSWNPFFCIMFGYIAKNIRNHQPSIKSLAICDNIIPHEKFFLDKFLMRFFLKQMDFHIVQSSIVQNELLTLVPEATYLKLFHPIYNVFGKPKPQINAKEELNINAKYIILYAGLIRSYKGFDILIKSVNYIAKQLDDFVVLAIGESYEKNKYNDLIKKEKIEKLFIWENRYVTDKEFNKYFSACDVVALPYRSASQSGIIPIAYHFNKPVVVTNVGGLPDMVINDKTGRVIPSEDPKVLAGVLSENLQNGKFKSMYSFISDYKKQFSWETFIKGIESLVSK